MRMKHRKVAIRERRAHRLADHEGMIGNQREGAEQVLQRILRTQGELSPEVLTGIATLLRTGVTDTPAYPVPQVSVDASGLSQAPASP